MFDISGLSHIELRVKDIESSLKYYRDTLGMIVVENKRSGTLLKCNEESLFFSIKLVQGDVPGLDHMSFKVPSEDDLNIIVEMCKENKIKYKTTKEEHIAKSIRFQDPAGFPVEFSTGIERNDFHHEDYKNMRGAFPLRLDHITVHTTRMDQAINFYKNKLSFIETEEIQKDHKQITGIFLARGRTTHDIAFFRASGPAVHHIAIRVRDIEDIIRICDILGSQNLIDQIEYGPGRHRATNGLFIYTRDPDGNRIELFTGDYYIDGSDWKPLIWQEEYRRIELWGHLPPPGFRTEKTRVFNVFSGNIENYISIKGEEPISL